MLTILLYWCAEGLPVCIVVLIWHYRPWHFMLLHKLPELVFVGVTMVTVLVVSKAVDSR